MSIIGEDVERIVRAPLMWSKLKNSAVLVTGATGFIASYIVLVLLALNRLKGFNIRIYALARHKHKFVKRFGVNSSEHGLVFIHSAVEDDFAEAIGPQLDYIIHAASFASPKFYGVDPVGTLKANTLGTFALLELAAKKSCSEVLYVSSSEVYGSPRNIPTFEDDYGYLNPINPRSCYAESKRMGETMCIAWANQYNVPVKIVRPFHTYGPGMELDDGRIYADLVKCAVNSEKISLNSDGSAIRAFCYLSDAVEGIFTVLLHGENCEAYNLGNADAAISILDLANMLKQEYPERIPSVVTEVEVSNGYIPSQVSKVVPDIGKLLALGWLPKVDVISGFRRTVESYL